MDQSPAKGSRHTDPKKPARTATFGRYRIEKEVGAGGMGTVYRAIDSQLNRVVALKILPKEKAKNDLLVKRFKSEGKAAAALRHENLVGVYDTGEIDGSLFIAMEFIEGIDGQDLVQRDGPLDVERSLHIIKQVALGLRHAYEQHIVHRDIKPSNLLIDEHEHVKLADFGLARSIDEEESTSITRAGTTVGTVDYMPPEQARSSKDADFRSDIYSLGATWYFLLVGKPPFPNGDVLNKLNQHANDPPPDPRKSNPEIPVSVVDVIHKMLGKTQQERHQTPDELLEDLERINLNQREVNYDLIASLGSEDAAADDDEAPRRKSKSREPEEKPLRNPSRSRAARPAPRSTREISRETRTDRRETRDDERRSKPNERDARRAVRPTDADTRSERDSSTTADSGRDGATSTRALRRNRQQSANVSFDSKKLITIAVAAIGLVVVLVLGSSAMKQAQQQFQPGASPSLVPQTVDVPSEPLKRNRPRKLGE